MSCRRTILLALLLAGCSSMVEPYQGLPRPAPRGAVEPGERVGICYSSLFSTPEKVRAAAVEACGRDAVPELMQQDMRLNCPLLTPVRATFMCMPQ